MAEAVISMDGKTSNGEAHLDNPTSKQKDPETTGQRLKRIAAVIVGVFIRLGVRSAELSRTQVIYFGFPGELLIRMLKMLFFLVNTLLASAICVIMALIIQPGAKSDGKSISKPNRLDDSTVPEPKEVIDSFLDLIRWYEMGKVRKSEIRIKPRKKKPDQSLKKNMENGQKSQTHELRDTHTVMRVRSNSIEKLRPNFSCDPDLPAESHSDVSEQIQDEKTAGQQTT